MPLKHFFLAAFALSALACNAQQTAADEASTTIWFDTPATLKGRAAWNKAANAQGVVPPNAGESSNADPEWETQSLPIGNGSIGANVMGSIATERYTLNEKTLWRGGPAAVADNPARYWNVNKASAQHIPAIRELLADGKVKEAGALTAENFCSDVPYEANREEQFRFGSFTTLGELCIATGIDEAGVTGYRRALRVDSALTHVSFDYDGAHYDRTAFISYPHNVMALRYTATKPGAQNLRIAYAKNPLSKGAFSETGEGELLFKGALDNNGMAYCVRLAVKAEGGTVKVEGGEIAVEGATAVDILLTADTDYKPNNNPDFANPYTYVGVDPVKTTGAWMKAAARTGFAKLLQKHYDDYSALFNRVSFKLDGKANNDATPRRLAAYRKGGEDRALETLYYQFGRYLLIASSRPGNLPANLQGIWHNNVDGPWRVDYHNNINLQMNYWPALSTNLTECNEPLADFIDLLRVPGRATAKEYFGARGWAASISANIFGFTAPLEGRDMSWNYNPMAAAWLATHLWDEYDFTRNRRFLKERAYPVLKECAQFTEDFLWKRADGSYTAAPSTSPEHGPVDLGTTFTHAVAREILLDAIAAAKVLKVDEAEAAAWQKVLDNIAPYKIGRYGQLMEWSRDIDDPKDQHRHVNHLYGLHPGRTISPVTTPDLAKASRVVLEHRGDGATGWSMGWKLNQWARLHDGNHSYVLYGNLLKNGTSDNLWDTHPPFQIDGNFGGTAGVTEMLLQSHAGCLHLLPALPDAWSGGSISGLRARGAFEVSLEWQGGRLVEARIVSLAGESCKVLYGKQELQFSTKKGKTYTLHLNEQGELKLA